MSRDEEIERRLKNWARWKLGATRAPQGTAGTNWDSFGMPRDPYGAQTPIPTDDDEAWKTDEAVLRLASELRAAVESEYLGAGSQAKKARRLGITERGMRDRIERAHRLLSSHFAAQFDRATAERARVEQLQLRSVPSRKEF